MKMRKKTLLLGVILAGYIVGCSYKNQNVPEQSVTETSEEENTEPSSFEERLKEIEQIMCRAEERAEKDREAVLTALGDEEADRYYSEALGYIQDQYPNYFSDDTLLKKSMEYGYYIEWMYKDSVGKGLVIESYFNMGNLISQAAQDIYTGIKTPEDTAVLESMQRVEGELQTMFGPYYGGYEDDFDEKVAKILIPAHAVMNQYPYFEVGIDDILTQPYEEYDSPETEEGYFHFFEEPGIIYAVSSPKEKEECSAKRICGVILTDSQYEFGCGLKVGLTLEELQELDMDFEDSSEETIPDYVFLTALKEKLDYDSVFIATEKMSYNFTYHDHISHFLAFVKDGKVIAVSIDETTGNYHECNPDISPCIVEI